MIAHNKPTVRERVKYRGAEHLSDYELLALTLRTGSRRSPVMNLAACVIKTLDLAKPAVVYEALMNIEGMGATKVSAVMAVMELGRRFFGIQNQKVHTAADLFPLLRHYADRKQEQFICVSLNGAHEVLAIRVVSIGILNRTIVHPREVYGDPISDRAAAIIVCHNHPSGQLEPSEEDRNITKRLYSAGELLGITLLDHLILSPRGGYFSFVEGGIPIG